MKKITTTIFLLLLVSMAAYSQELKIEGDTSIVLIEGNNRMVMDSIQLESKINQVKGSIRMVDNQLLKIEATKAKGLEQKSSLQSTLTYFLEIRNNYQKLKSKLQNAENED